MYSLTYVGIIVFVLGKLAELAGVKIGSEELTTMVNTIIQLGGALIALYGRFRKGDVKWFGVRK